MTKPIARTPEAMVKELLAQNFQLSQENRLLMRDLKKANDELAELKNKPAEPAKRPSIRP